MRLIDADAINKYLKDNGLKRDIYIDTAPTVDSVVHGHWVKSNNYSDEPDYSCSECKCIVERVPDDYGGSRALTTDYCPYCGACMDEDKEREDANERKAAIPGSTSFSERAGFTFRTTQKN